MRKRLVTVLTLLSLGVAAAPALAAAPAKATLTIGATPKAVLGHEVVTVHGGLTPVRVGRTVVLQEAVGTSWKTIGHTKTVAKGAYTVRTRAPLTGTERLRTLVVASDHSQVLSKVVTVAPVRPAISLSSASWVLSGTVLRTSGRFLPVRPGRTVALQRQSGARWVTIATAHLDAHSRFAMNALVTAAPGTLAVRVLAEPFGGAVVAASAPRLVTVAGTPPTLLGPFTQVFLGLKPGSTPGSYTTLPGTPALDFTDDGRLTSVVPVAGPGAGAAALAPTVRTGVYAAHDGVVDIAWDIDGTTVTLRPNSLGQLVWNGVTYGVVDPLASAHLSGTYKRLLGGTGATITFTAAGRFNDDGVTGDTGLPTTDNPSGGGTYTVRDNTLFLVYDSGPLETMAVYALPQWLGGKAQLVLAGTTFGLIPTP
ncbi:hypothetical protein acdb102_41830 [Acidothermaceae bacterium B102]|nr:hypothetical protein acdb102_41830 [Acidothermaceae bacterium B102]